MIIAGKVLICSALALIMVAYSNFAPTTLQSDGIAGYVKNHFVREMIFGVGLAILAIGQTISASTKPHVWKAALIGSIVVLPFWIAVLFGWSTGGLADVWGGKINSDAAYIFHGVQMTLFYLGLGILGLGLRLRGRSETEKKHLHS